MINNAIAQDLDEIFRIIGLKENTTESKEHGKVVEYRQEAYCDVKVYEDGYEERFYIGE